MWFIAVLSAMLSIGALLLVAHRIPNKILPWLAIGLLVLSVVSPVLVYRGFAHDIEFTVNDDAQAKMRTDRWLVFTDQGVFEVTDTYSFWDFNASDRFGALHRGKRYRAHVAGMRFGWMSWYPNIVKVTPLDS